MSLQFTPYVLPAAASTVLLAALALTTWRQRPVQGAMFFCLLMLAMAEWSLGYVLELTSYTFSSALLWDNLAWIGAIAAPTLWLIFVLRYTGWQRWMTRQYLALLAVEPFVTLVLLWSNGFHGLIERAWMEVSSPFSAVLVTYGVWYWINITYSYALLFLGVFVLCSFTLKVARSARLFCALGACLLVATGIPWMGNIVMISGLNPFPYVNLTPFTFLLSSFAFWAVLFIFHSLDIVPIPHEKVIQSMREGVIVLDSHNRVVDLNPAAQLLANCKASQAIGRPFAEIFRTWPELVKFCHGPQEVDDEVIASEGEKLRYFSVSSTSLYRRYAHPSVAGRLVVLHDITEHIQAEMTLKDNVERFRSIFAEVPIGIAVVDLEGHLLQVNNAFCEMLGYGEQELIGFSLLAITHPDDVGADMFLAGKALAGEIASYKVEKRYLKKNHETLWADLTTTILRNPDGEAIYGLVMLENIIERKRTKLLEEERYHVAYELHDGLAQVVVSVHQHLQALASHYHPRSPQARKELDRALELAQRSVKEARRLIAGLRPTVLDDFGLATALRLQVEALRNDGWTLIFEEVLGPERLPPTIETTLFGVAQEALTNIRKHSHTTRARLSLERQDANIRLEVQDWGCGFEPRTLFKVYRPGEHVGIRAMQERVELLGGHLLVTSHPGFGTLVAAKIPILPSNEKDHGDASNAVGSEASSQLLRSHLTETIEYDVDVSVRNEVGPLLLRSHLIERTENNEH